MGYRFNPPPNWPAPPPGWVPSPGWRPSPEWPAPPPGWLLWIDDTARASSQGRTVHRHAGGAGESMDESRGARDFLADAFGGAVIPATPKEWLEDKTKLLIKGLACLVVGLIVHRWALLSSPVRPLKTAAGIRNELLRPTAVPEIFVNGMILFYENTLLFIGYFLYRVGPAFRRGILPSNILQRGGPLPRGFWRFYIGEIFGTFLIPIGLLGFLLTGHGIFTWFMGWVFLASTIISLPRILALTFCLARIIAKRRFS